MELHANTVGIGPPPSAIVDDDDPIDGYPQGRPLSPEFIEWVMGFEPGYTLGPSRAERIKKLGNAVVPPQAIHAFKQLLDRSPL